MMKCDEMCWAGMEKDVSWKFFKDFKCPLKMKSDLPISGVFYSSLSIKFLYSLFQMLI